VARLDADLAGRQQALEHVLALLDEATAGAAEASSRDVGQAGPRR
jgi:hypothetical protein